MRNKHFLLKNMQIFICMLLVILACAVVIHADGTNTIDNTMRVGSNVWGKFSQNNLSDTEFAIDKEVKHSQNDSARIINHSQDYSRYSLPLSLDTNSEYKISCWVKTKNVGLNRTGACLSVEGKDIYTMAETYIKPFSNNGTPNFELIEPKESKAGPRHVSTSDLTGNNGMWQKLNLHIGTGETMGDIIVFFELGRPGRENIGEAWFTDLVVEKIDPTIQRKTAVGLETMNFLLLFLIIGVVIFLYKAEEKKNQKKGIRASHFEETVPKQTRNQKIIVGLIFIAAILIRFGVSVFIEGHLLDIYCFKIWSSVSTENLFNMYSSGVFIDYPPLYIYMLFAIGKVIGFFNLYSVPWLYNILIKLPTIIAEVLTAVILYRTARPRYTFKKTAFITGIFMFSATLILDTCAWAQTDSLLALVVIIALLFVCKEKYEFSSVFFALAILLKPQGIIMLPILFFSLVKNKEIKRFVTSFLSAAATVVLVVFPFALKEGPLWIFKLYMTTLGEYETAVQGAFNLFGLVGGTGKPDDTILFVFSYRVWGFIFIILSTCFVGYLYLKSKEKFIPFLGAFVLFTSVYMLSSRIHTRYLLPSLGLALFLYVFSNDKRILLIYGCFNFMLYQCIDQLFLKTMYFPIELGSFINMCLFIWLIFISIDMALKKKIVGLGIGKSRGISNEISSADQKKKKKKQ